MRIKFLALGLVCLFMVNCFMTTAKQLNEGRVEFIETHPGLLMPKETDPNLLSKIKDAILSGEIILGMNVMQVMASRGVPLDINSSTGEWGTHSQWIYVGIEANPRMHTSKKEWRLDHKYAYIYFENGKVTSWQSR